MSIIPEKYWLYLLLAILVIIQIVRVALDRRAVNVKRDSSCIDFDSLDTPAGHIVILLFLAFALPLLGYTDWVDTVMGALLMRLTGMRTNRELKNGHPKFPSVTP